MSFLGLILRRYLGETKFISYIGWLEISQILEDLY